MPWIIATEAAERFSYYGMRAILTTFLVTQFLNPYQDPVLQAQAEAAANARTHFFVSLAYVMPVLGAFMADAWLGRYRVIVLFSLVYCLGHLGLSLQVHDLDGFLLALLLLALGAGGIKANVSAFVGDQFLPQTDPLARARAYGAFYVAINAGAVVSMALVPWLLATHGPALAFGVPGVAMLLALACFLAGRHRYRRQPPVSPRVLWRHWREDWPAIRRVLGVLVFIPWFWALWDQSQSEWVLQAAHLDLAVFPGLTLLPAQVQLVNPALILLLVPLFTRGLYPMLARRGLAPTPLRRLLVGLLLTALATLIVAGIQHEIDLGGRPSVWWQLLAYLVLTVGEVLVSVTGLEFAYAEAPPRLRSLVTALWLLTVSLGNLLLAGVNANMAAGGWLVGLQGANFYVACAGVQLLLLPVFVWSIRRRLAGR